MPRLLLGAGQASSVILKGLSHGWGYEVPRERMLRKGQLASFEDPWRQARDLTCQVNFCTVTANTNKALTVCQSLPSAGLHSFTLHYHPMRLVLLSSHLIW